MRKRNGFASGKTSVVVVAVDDSGASTVAGVSTTNHTTMNVSQISSNATAKAATLRLRLCAAL
jgi:hypothetical protein